MQYIPYSISFNALQFHQFHVALISVILLADLRKGFGTQD